MKKNKFNNIIGLTLVEILIGIVVSMLMMGAMYTSYSIVNNTYSQVTSRATISRAGRDVVGMMMRDIRMAGFKFYGDTARYVPGDTLATLEKSHAPLIITKERGAASGNMLAGPKVGRFDALDRCCDQIDIVYGDYDREATEEDEKFLRYKITYYANREKDNTYYGIYKSKKKWNEAEDNWTVDAEVCDSCFEGELVRDYLVDMEFVTTDGNGKVIDPPPTPLNANNTKLYLIKNVDVSLTFRSTQDFFKVESTPEKPRMSQGLGKRNREYYDKLIRESIVVSVHTRNIGAFN